MPYKIVSVLFLCNRSIRKHRKNIEPRFKKSGRGYTRNPHQKHTHPVILFFILTRINVIENQTRKSRSERAYRYRSDLSNVNFHRHFKPLSTHTLFLFVNASGTRWMDVRMRVTPSDKQTQSFDNQMCSAFQYDGPVRRKREKRWVQKNWWVNRFGKWRERNFWRYSRVSSIKTVQNQPRPIPLMWGMFTVWKASPSCSIVAFQPPTA